MTFSSLSDFFELDWSDSVLNEWPNEESSDDISEAFSSLPIIIRGAVIPRPSEEMFIIDNCPSCPSEAERSSLPDRFVTRSVGF